MESKDTAQQNQPKEEEKGGEKQKEFTHPDTGEKISKSQYKAIMKQKQKAEQEAKKKAEKEAKAKEIGRAHV